MPNSLPVILTLFAPGNGVAPCVERLAHAFDGSGVITRDVPGLPEVFGEIIQFLALPACDEFGAFLLGEGQEL